MDDMNIKNKLENELMVIKNNQVKTVMEQLDNGYNSMLVTIKEIMNTEIPKMVKKEVEKHVDEIKQNISSLVNEVTTISTDNGIIKSNVTNLENGVKTIKEEVELVTKTFLTNGWARRIFDNHVHKLTYRYTRGKGTVCDDLFHGTITRFCKESIKQSLDVKAVDFIKVDDLETTKTLANAYMKPFRVREVISKKLKVLRDRDESKAGLKPHIKKLYEAYLDETCGGNDINVGF